MISAGASIGDVLQVAIFLIVVLGSIFGPMIERYARKKREEAAARRAQETGRPSEPVEEEAPDFEPAKLPYEELAEEVFGGYIEQRKREHEERKALQEAEARADDDIIIREVIEEAPEPAPAYRPRVRERRPEPAVRVVEVIPKPSKPIAAPTLPPVAGVAETHAPLDVRIFKGRLLHPALQAIVYAEVFGPSRAARMLRGERPFGVH